MTTIRIACFALRAAVPESTPLLRLGHQGLRQVIGCVAIWTALAVPAAASQVLPGEAEHDINRAQLRRYHESVVRYRGGSADSVDGILQWDRTGLQRVVGLVGSVLDDRRPWPASHLKAAAMLHTDAAARVLQGAESETALLHLRTAATLLAKGGADLRTHAGRWCQAVAWMLRSANRLPAAEQFLESARSQWPDDSLVLYESGALQELLASDARVPRVIYLADLKPPPSGPSTTDAETDPPLTRDDVNDLRRRRRDRLDRAARWLQGAVARDPANRLAHLRLGRVQTLRGRYTDALPALAEAARAEDAAVAYLAVLFTGALHERSGRLDAAAGAYRQAVDRFPLNHAAYIGLSALLHRAGRYEESRDLLGRIVDGATASRRDPWWSYFAEAPAVTTARLDVLRREARE